MSVVAPAASDASIEDSDAHELSLVRTIQTAADGTASPSASAAWAELLARYQDRLFGVCIRMVNDRDMAADLTQDAMVKIIEGLSSYDGRAKLSTWMIRVTMNVCLSKLRSEKLRRHASLDGMGAREGRSGEQFADVRLGTSGATGGELRPDRGVIRGEGHARVAQALCGLPLDQRSLLVLRDCRNLDYEQIAEILDVPVGTVKSRLFRARAALREALEAQDRVGEGPSV
jgi:RNA polymerase sigma-70 factor (ECF subfamily)